MKFQKRTAGRQWSSLVSAAEEERSDKCLLSGCRFPPWAWQKLFRFWYWLSPSYFWDLRKSINLLEVSFLMYKIRGMRLDQRFEFRLVEQQGNITQSSYVDGRCPVVWVWTPALPLSTRVLKTSDFASSCLCSFMCLKYLLHRVIASPLNLVSSIYVSH